MKLLTFKPGGIHLHDNKLLTELLPIEIMPEPSVVHIPLSQHIGLPSKSIVKKGDYVYMGQTIGEAQGGFSVPVHASVSGKVAEIGVFSHPSGVPQEAIKIQSDKKSQWHPNITLQKDTSVLFSQDQLAEIIQNSGIVGMGGATFPTHIKLSPPKEFPVDTLIINGAECEPYLTCDHRLMLEKADVMLDGIIMLAEFLKVKQIFIGVEENKKDCVQHIQNLCKDRHDRLIPKIVLLKEKYPQGAEKSLIFSITRRIVPIGKLPFYSGVIVHNVATVIAIAEAIQLKKPLIERVVTVTGDLIQNPKNLLVRIGTSIGEIIDFCGGMKNPPKKVILGGPMMGLTQRNLDTPVTKGVSGVLLLSSAAVPVESACIRCGTCIEHCPAGLMPIRLQELSLCSDFEKAKYYHPLSCIECGICSYQCPAKIHLLMHIRDVKAEMNKRSRK